MYLPTDTLIKLQIHDSFEYHEQTFSTRVCDQAGSHQE